MTIHKSQGATCDHVYVVGPAGLYREATYVAMSRARHSSHLYATLDQAHELLTEPDHSTGLPLPTQDLTSDRQLLDRLQTSRAKHLAVTQAPGALDVDALSQLTLGQLDDLIAEHGRITVDAVRLGLENPTHIRRRYEQAAASRSRLTVGGRVRALDRDNIGTVTRIDDQHGRATVTFITDDGRIANRDLSWHQVHPIDAAEPIIIPAAAVDHLASLHDAVTKAEKRWSAHLEAVGLPGSDLGDVEEARVTRASRLARDLAAAPPPWLISLTGSRPLDPVGAALWDDAIHHLAEQHDRTMVEPTAPGAGYHLGRLLNHEPTPGPIDLDALDHDGIAERLKQLDALIETLPRPTAGGVEQPMLPTLTQAQMAIDGTNARHAWILANWPHIVEQQQLTTLVAATRSQLPLGQDASLRPPSTPETRWRW